MLIYQLFLFIFTIYIIILEQLHLFLYLINKEM